MVPQLMPLAHGEAPLRHGALGIILGDVGELFLGLLVPERMQQRHTALKRLLDGRRARHREMHRTELLLAQILMMMSFIG